MVWSKWYGSLVVTLAWAGLALCQQVPPPPSGGEPILTLMQTGGASIRCRVIADWTTPEGGRALQVQDVASGEMITVIEGTKPGDPNAQPKRIIHWGDSKTPPPGVPVPPAAETARALPIIQTAKAPAFVPAPSPVIVNGGSPAPKTNSPKLPVIVNAPPPSDVPPMVISESPPPRTLGSRIAERIKEIGPARPAHITPERTVSAPPPVVATSEVKVPARVVETHQPADWRESWGKTAATGTEPAPVVVPPPSRRPEPQTTPGYFAKSNPRQDLQAQTTDRSEAPGRPVAQTAPGYYPGSNPRQDLQAQAAPYVPGQPLDGNLQRVPVGVQSVLAAGDGQAQYIPVPVVTAPPITRMPQPPNPVRQPGGMPMPTPPSDEFVNAFTPPQGASPPQMPMMPGNGMYPQGPMAPGYGRMPVPPMPMRPMMPMGQAGPAAMPTGFQGPIRVTPIGPQAGQIDQQLATLKNALYPSHREMAVINLSDYNAQYYPQVVRALVTAAKDDPAPTVRAACVSGLVKMQANSPEVVGVLSHLRNDDDPRVRQEVDQALARFAPGSAPAAEVPNLQPAQAEQR